MNHPKDTTGEREKQVRDSDNVMKQLSPLNREAKHKAGLSNLAVLFVELLTDIRPYETVAC